MWLVVHNCCWMVLADEFCHTRIIFLIVTNRTKQLITCLQTVSSRDNFGTPSYSGLAWILCPPWMTINFEWWNRINEATNGSVQNGLNSIVILGVWTFWKHRNRCIFDGVNPNLASALILAEEKGRLWCLARAQGLSFYIAKVLGGYSQILVWFGLWLWLGLRHTWFLELSVCAFGFVLEVLPPLSSS